MKQTKNNLSKIYLSTDDLEKSQQAQLRMKKKIPYARPAIEAWLDEGKVS